VPQRPQKPLGYAELKYLEAKGAFSLPSNELSEQLLDAYFTYVHPLLPVIEMTSFWKRYELQKPGNVSPLLLQSMFLAASSVSSIKSLFHYTIWLPLTTLVSSFGSLSGEWIFVGNCPQGSIL
jgi:hypothetical protein